MPRLKALAAAYQDADFQKAIRVGMAAEDLKVPELCRLTGINRDTFRRRMDSPTSFSLKEVRELKKAGVLDALSLLKMVGFSDRELNAFARGE